MLMDIQKRRDLFFDEAISEFDIALKINPNDPITYTNKRENINL